MKSNVTMKDIAKELNVSIVTVSKALGGKEGVGEELKKKIVECADKMGYRLNSLARSMKEGYSYNVGVIVSEKFVGPPQAFYPLFYQYISQSLGEQGYSMIIQVLSLQDEENLVLPRAYSESKIDGLIVLGQISLPYAQLLQSCEIPIVLLDFYDERIDIDSVVSDNFCGSYEITSILIKSGHRDIAFIGDIYATSSIQDRFLGYYKALLESGIKLREEYIINDRDKEGRYIELAFPDKMPTAFVCNNDVVAYNLILKLREMGFNVPDDCSVVGFDNSVHSVISSPQITTMGVNLEEMGKTAGKFIVNKIRKENKRYGKVTIKENIYQRESVKSLVKINERLT
ncbi:MAG: LacI family transcriptional regulator [Ruminiclostridium sp.]|nr:LacI family transcriptional regulator [Ruminiclostridium sp.]